MTAPKQWLLFIYKNFNTIDLKRVWFYRNNLFIKKRRFRSLFQLLFLLNLKWLLYKHLSQHFFKPFSKTIKNSSTWWWPSFSNKTICFSGQYRPETFPLSIYEFCEEEIWAPILGGFYARSSSLSHLDAFNELKFSFYFHKIP